ncbi:MAG: bifunctional diguanylate cyclase/phosphodiesterase [Lachnospiraceae bacterium]|nr:bifunctional diguanylate cyclase/phosphodiesterase [Lachnospiraceae bacterium]
MKFSIINEEPNIETAKNIIDSVLNAGYNPTLVIDKSSYEILYQNKRALDLLGDRIGRYCHEVFCTRDIPCIDCPVNGMIASSVVKVKHEELFDKNAKWLFSNINWFDGRNAVLATLLEVLDESQDIIAREIADKMSEEIEVDIQEIDSLTHIPTITKFYRETEKAIHNNLDKSYAIIVFDIDHFKSVNDLYGMTKGDDVLRHIGQVLKAMFGSEDNYARMHSDMFAFYMSYEKKGDIVKLAEKIKKKINTNDLNVDEINVSFGIYLVEDVEVPINLMCDRAMMASDNIKGNIMKFCAFYDEQYREAMLKTSEIEHEMHRALEDGEFHMYLQPKYRLTDEYLCGAEVLCRWVHPKKGIIPPMEFIPLFEKNGFIIKLDEYMWEQACKTLREWIDQGRKPIPLSVNISRYHIQHNDLENVLMGLITKYDLSPKLLVLEITESLFLDKPEELNRVLVKLQELGFKLEVDDFGSGFSSLNLIRNISVDTIKIDKEFLDSEMASEKGKIVVNHTIDMAKDLMLQVIAEGVETEQHVEFLKNSKCDVAQGYYFARPMPLTEFNEFNF